MIRFRFMNIEFRLHLLVILTCLLAYALGLNTEMPVVMMSLGIHELAHIAAAKACGMEIEYIDITCFGGAAKLRNIYAANRLKLIIVALSGPTANLIMAAAGAALAWWGIIGFYAGSLLVQINIILMLFNLMPALPLDGGRVLYAIASIWIHRRTAIRVGVIMACLLALLLCGAAIYSWVNEGVFNITLVLMAVFLIATSIKELEYANESSADRIVAAMCHEDELPGKAVVAAVSKDIEPSKAAEYMLDGKTTLFAIVENGIVTEMITGNSMAKRMLI
ncbi:MAG: hypothetical protein IJC56_11745 [Clostridia bacterium]|nr:hypothetical protein [Clostridia bacterium]